VCTVATAYQGAAIYTCPGYRLPSEAEFEYASRAGSTASLSNGEVTVCIGKSDPKADLIGWYKNNSQNKTHPVGQLATNGWGLRDMAGNVWEWMHDPYVSNLGSGAQVDPMQPSAPGQAVRGGSYASDAGDLRSAARSGAVATASGSDLGFRCVRTLP
jgi:formylglycine-generating enzyme required for sulfatase activity